MNKRIIIIITIYVIFIVQEKKNQNNQLFVESPHKSDSLINKHLMTYYVYIKESFLC